eukprot:9475933-Pyramimonas_sp.AAC.1
MIQNHESGQNRFYPLNAHTFRGLSGDECPTQFQPRRRGPPLRFREMLILKLRRNANTTTPEQYLGHLQICPRGPWGGEACGEGNGGGSGMMIMRVA